MCAWFYIHSSLWVISEDSISEACMEQWRVPVFLLRCQNTLCPGGAQSIPSRRHQERWVAQVPGHIELLWAGRLSSQSGVSDQHYHSNLQHTRKHKHHKPCPDMLTASSKHLRSNCFGGDKRGQDGWNIADASLHNRIKDLWFEFQHACL